MAPANRRPAANSGNVLPAIVDEYLVLELLDFGDKKPVRALVCTEPIWNVPAKDRSGKNSIKSNHPVSKHFYQTDFTQFNQRRNVMTAFDYSNATAPADMELIPDGLVAIVQTRVREGGGSEDGVLKRSKDGRSEGLDGEFILVDTKHAKMKFWQNLLLAGETDGHKQMIERSKSHLKAMLDSAYGLKPDDTSAEARAKRTKELRDFDGLRFLVKIAIEKGKAEERRIERVLQGSQRHRHGNHAGQTGISRPD